jgi:hypothetical protein
LLRCRRRMRMLVRAMVLGPANVIFAHTEIVPLYASAGKAQPHARSTTAGVAVVLPGPK